MSDCFFGLLNVRDRAAALSQGERWHKPCQPRNPVKSLPLVLLCAGFAPVIAFVQPHDQVLEQFASQVRHTRPPAVSGPDEGGRIVGVGGIC